MKFFPKVLVTISALLSVASAVDLGSRAAAASSSMKSQVQTSTSTSTNTNTNRNTNTARRVLVVDGGSPWDNGTKVYNDFPNEGWWSGTITSFNAASGMYTVTWEDGSTDYYDNGDKIDEMVAYAQNDPQNNPAGAEKALEGVYPTGTPVSVYEEGEWYDGVVVQFGSGTYTVKWDEDGEIEQIQAGAIMDKMVEDANGDDDSPPAGYEGGPSTSASAGTFSLGTKVSIYEDGEWDDGKITGYAQGTYQVVWSDGTVDEYDDFGDDFDELKLAVEDGIGDDDAPPSSAGSSFQGGPKFPVGTPVSDYEEGAWVDGEVVDFKDGNYVVQWDDEDEIEYYDSHDAEDMQELTQMSVDAEGDDDAPPASFYDDQDLWEAGTRVAVTEDNQIWYGKVEGFSKGEYTIAWDDGEKESLDNFDLVNQMVSNAVTSPGRKSSKSGMNAAGKAFLSLFIISVCIVGSVFGYKFYEKRRAERVRELELTSEDGDADSPTYRDQPDNLPKII